MEEPQSGAPAGDLPPHGLTRGIGCNIGASGDDPVRAEPTPGARVGPDGIACPSPRVVLRRTAQERPGRLTRGRGHRWD